jgi:Subtilase family
MRTCIVLSLLCLSVLSCSGQLVPFFNDPSYKRDEPIQPPWWAKNNGLPSHLYHIGSLSSVETGTNDLTLITAWRMQPVTVMVGMVDQTVHGDKVQDLIRTTTHGAPVYRHELLRWNPADIAAGIMDCANAGCRVICVTTGFSYPDPVLYAAFLYAESAKVIVVCAVPDIEGNLDNGLVDYPYEWRLPNVLPATMSDRSGNRRSPSGYGTNCITAPGRNIVSAGTYATGTSYSAPILAGCVAMLVSKRPDLQASEYIEVIRRTSNGTAHRVDIVAALHAVPLIHQSELAPELR